MARSSFDLHKIFSGLCIGPIWRFSGYEASTLTTELPDRLLRRRVGFQTISVDWVTSEAFEAIEWQVTRPVYGLGLVTYAARLNSRRDANNRQHSAPSRTELRALPLNAAIVRTIVIRSGK